MQEDWRTLRSDLFPSKVVLDLTELVLIAQRLPTRRQPEVETWAVPLPAATCRAGRPLQAEALGDFIGDLLLSHDEIKAHLSVVLPAAATHCRVLEWPLREWPLDPAQRLRQLQPDLGLPFDLDQAYLDLIPLQAGAEAQALVVAIERDLLASWLEVFGIAGVRLDRFVPAQVAVTVGLQEQLAAADPSALVGVLLPEPKALRLLVWRAGLPLYERLLMGATEQWMQQLQTCLDFLVLEQPGPSGGGIQLLLAAGLYPDQQQELQLACPYALEPVEADGYGSLALRGLARLEAAR